MVDHATGNDLPNDNTATEESKKEEQDAAENLVQGPKNNPAPDGDYGSSSSSGSGVNSGRVCGSAGARGELLTRS